VDIALKHSQPQALGAETAPDLEDESEESPLKWFLCAGCGAKIARLDNRTSVTGSHIHVRSNPVGLNFTIACFIEALGCSAAGSRSSYWSWFPGYEWQLALCRRCTSHLGWKFSGPDIFWALVVDQIVEEK